MFKCSPKRLLNLVLRFRPISQNIRCQIHATAVMPVNQLLECVSIAVPELLDQLQIIAGINFVGDHKWCGVMHTIGHSRSGGIAPCHQTFRSTSLICKGGLMAQTAQRMQCDAPGSTMSRTVAQNYGKRERELRRVQREELPPEMFESTCQDDRLGACAKKRRDRLYAARSRLLLQELLLNF